MAIRKVDATTEIKVGQWVLRGAHTGICGMPRQVTKISKSQYHFIAGEGDDTRARFYTRDSLRYVCDTEVEGHQLYEISQRCYKAEEEAAAQARRKHYDELNAVIAASGAAGN